MMIQFGSDANHAIYHFWRPLRHVRCVPRKGVMSVTSDDIGSESIFGNRGV